MAKKEKGSVGRNEILTYFEMFPLTQPVQTQLLILLL
jgi:hypothetical protein